MEIQDKELLEAYTSALELNLDNEFVSLLENEIKNRNLSRYIEKVLLPV